MLGHPALVLVQARILRPAVLSRRVKLSFVRFLQKNALVAQSGFHFTFQLHVKSAQNSAFSFLSILATTE